MRKVFAVATNTNNSMQDLQTVVDRLRGFKVSTSCSLEFRLKTFVSKQVTLNKI